MADDGKRRMAILEVDASPLRANKGGSLRGGRAQKEFYARRVGGFMEGLGCFFRSCGSFFALLFASLFYIKFMLIFVRFCRGFQRVLGGHSGPKIEIFCVFGVFLSRSQFCIFLLDFWLQTSAKNMWIFDWIFSYRFYILELILNFNSSWRLKK